MNNYPKIPFTEIATLIRGVSYDKSVALLAAKDGFIPILRANNIQKNLVLADLVYVPSDLVKEEQMIRKGDIILAMSSGSKDLVGKSAQADTNIDAAFGTFCGLIRAKENVDSKFLGLYFQTQEYRNFVSYQSQGVNICNLKKKDIESLQIPLPPLATQHAIVTRIETLFAELDKAVQHLRTAQQQLKTYRQAVLNHSFSNETWENVSITDIIEKEKNSLKAGPFGSSLKKEYYVEDGYKVYGQEQVISGDPFIGNYYIDEDKYKELESCKIKSGDVLISLVGTVGKILILPENIKPGIINPRLIKITLNRQMYDSKFFKYYFESSQVKSFYKINASGTTMDVLNIGIIKQIPFPLPPLTEQ